MDQWNNVITCIVCIDTREDNWMFEVGELLQYTISFNIKHLIFADHDFHLNLGYKLVLRKFRTCKKMGKKSKTKKNLMHKDCKTQKQADTKQNTGEKRATLYQELLDSFLPSNYSHCLVVTYTRVFSTLVSRKKMIHFLICKYATTLFPNDEKI